MKCVLLTVAALVLTASMASAQAVYPGAGCIKTSDSSGLQNFASDKGIYQYQNPSTDKTTAQVIVCPIIRVNTTNSFGLFDLEVQLYNLENKLTCTAVSTAMSEGTKVLSVAKTSVYGPIGTQRDYSKRFDWGASLNRSEAWGTYTVLCAMPLYGYLGNYFVQEY